MTGPLVFSMKLSFPERSTVMQHYVYKIDVGCYSGLKSGKTVEAQLSSCVLLQFEDYPTLACSKVLNSFFFSSVENNSC